MVHRNEPGDRDAGWRGTLRWGTLPRAQAQRGSMSDAKTYRAGDTVDDRCRVCKDVRAHHVTVLDEASHPLRVVRDRCGSQHNYRGQGDDDARVAPPSPAAPRESEPRSGRWRPGALAGVTERERRYAAMSISVGGDP